MGKGREKIKGTMRGQLSRLIFAAMVPFLAMTIVLLGLLVLFNYEYTTTLKNADTAAEFNFDFKTTVDLEMYYYVVGSKDDTDIPYEYVSSAEAILHRLETTTEQSDNLWRIGKMLDMCKRLRESIDRIVASEGYDSRMTQLDNDIRTITTLIDRYMHAYIYDEILTLSKLQREINGRITMTIVTTAIITAALIFVILIYSRRVSFKVSEPIRALVEKTLKLGGGDFDVEPVGTGIVEIKALDDGFNDMSGRMNELLDRVKKDQEVLRRAEMGLLQAQINPHFLYNTLDSIIWLAESRRDADVIRLVTNLSTFFRNSLSKGQDIITIADEEKQVCSYLEIQQIRYSDIMEFESDIPEALYPFSIPKLTLQPLVENALYHGIKNKRGRGSIRISGRFDGNDILLVVEDDGVGMTPEVLAKLRAAINDDKVGKGFGLVNVQKRLKLYCGDEYGLTFESTPGGGASATVRIPKQIKQVS
ncbi:MAG: sensor histidine kinase [Clostridiales Family XIII bacterium]|jgi:two-component system sensor histidine kinase YesM|nr:sensor histidine kinase [Clostridiales Family XIII bacterium]